MPVDNNKTTPRFIEVLNSVIDGRLIDLHVALPGEVIYYDVVRKQVAVLPMIKKKYFNQNEAVELPILNNVPVVFPRSGKSHLVFPISRGDTGQILFNERSIDVWQMKGERVDPGDPRKHDLNDAVFIPGLSSQENLPKVSSMNNSLELKHGDAVIEIREDAKFLIRNNEVELLLEIMNLLLELIDGFNELSTSHQTNTMLGPQKPINFSRYREIKEGIEAIEKKIEKLGAF